MVSPVEGKSCAFLLVTLQSFSEWSFLIRSVVLKAAFKCIKFCWKLKFHVDNRADNRQRRVQCEKGYVLCLTNVQKVFANDEGKSKEKKSILDSYADNK